MKVIDTSVLVNAVNTNSIDHAAARGWLDRVLNEDEAIGLPWVTLTGFTRISTHPRVFDNPLSVHEALRRVETWLSRQPAVVVTPTARHFSIWSGLLTRIGTGGNLTTDAHIAALALEHNAEVVTFDRDFERFGVRYVVPA